MKHIKIELHRALDLYYWKCRADKKGRKYRVFHDITCGKWVVFVEQEEATSEQGD